MTSKLVLIALCMFSSLIAFGQHENSSLETIIDELTVKWDTEAEILKTYEGMREYCKNRQHRVNTIDLVKEIHHYDSVLYKIVKETYDQKQDTEAKRIIENIEALESTYTTKGFLQFLHKECSIFNDIEKNYGNSKGKAYQKEVLRMEKKLGKYVDAITKQIDLVDDNMHRIKVK